MKKLSMLLMIVMFSLVFFGCSEREEESAEQETGAKSGVTISFDTGFDIGQISPIYLDGVSGSAMPDDPVYAGYIFLGWYYDKEYTRIFSKTDGFTEDTTLYAKWEKLFSGEEEEVDQNTVTENGFVYLKKDEEYFLKGYAGYFPDITVPSAVSDIPVVGILPEAFSGTAVRSIALSSEIKTIESGAFAGAMKLQEINVSTDNRNYLSSDGILYNKEVTALVCMPASRSDQQYTLPDKVTDILPYALYGCKGSIAFTEQTSYAAVGEKAFSAFYGSVTLPSKVVTISKDAFSGATCDIVFSESGELTALQNGEFSGYIGKKITLPATIRSISGPAFYGCGAEVDMTNTGLTELGPNAFYGYVGTQIFIPSSIRSFGSGCFYNCSSEITFDERSTIQTIGEKSFSNFGGVVTFPSTVNKVERYAFYHAQTGAKIVFSAKQSQIVIDETAFASCGATVVYQ